MRKEERETEENEERKQGGSHKWREDKKCLCVSEHVTIYFHNAHVGQNNYNLFGPFRVQHGLSLVKTHFAADIKTGRSEAGKCEL